MAEIKVLIKGYVREQKGKEFATSTTTFIRDAKLKVIVDPGMDRKLLFRALRKEQLSTSDIDFVVLTHDHLDHSLLSGIFENAKVLNSREIYSWDGKIESYQGLVPGTGIKVVQTPGHDISHCSLFVQTKTLGKVAVVGDVFWWSDKEVQKTDTASLLKHKDPYLKNKGQLLQSRKKVLAYADYIIPGHGRMFKVKK